MQTFLIILFFLLAVIFQTALVPFLAVSGIVPNLVLVLVLVLVILKSFRKIWWSVLLAALCLDAFSGLPFGLISLSLVGTVYLVDLFNKNIFSAVKLWITVSLIIMGSLLYHLFLIGLTGLFSFEIAFSIRYLFIELLYNLLIAIIFFYGAKKIFHQE